MEQRDFLGDEVHMMQNDIKALRTENTLLKLKNERQDQEIVSLREENSRLQASHEQRTIELASLRAVLENVGQVITHGLERYVSRRKLKDDTTLADRKQTAPSFQVGNGGAGAGTTTNESRTDDHPLLPRVEMSNKEERKLLNDLEKTASGDLNR
jgi:hypothetical protein